MRDVPDHIYRRLEEQAARERRSLAQQAITVLARGLNTALDPKARRQKLVRDLREYASVPGRLTDPARLIRKDRQR